MLAARIKPRNKLQRGKTQTPVIVSKNSKPYSKDSYKKAKEKTADAWQNTFKQKLVQVTGAADRGVKHARFVVLIGANVPSILVETGFISNPTESLETDNVSISG